MKALEQNLMKLTFTYSQLCLLSNLIGKRKEPNALHKTLKLHQSLKLICDIYECSGRTSGPRALAGNNW